MTNLKDIYWLAGLLEGEASFSYTQHVGYPAIELNMTDSDIIIRASEIMRGHNNIRTRLSNIDNHKDSYRFGVYGNKAAAWMMTLYPLMSRRRQEQIAHQLKVWKWQPSRKIHVTLNKEQQQEIYRRKNAGDNVKKIAADYNIYFMSVYRICDRIDGKV